MDCRNAGNGRPRVGNPDAHAFARMRNTGLIPMAVRGRMAATVAERVGMTSDKAPDDIDPRSGNRLAPPRREELDERTTPLFDRLADPSGGSLAGLQAWI